METTMTPTKDRLATELRKIASCKTDRSPAYEALAVRAAAGEFDDYSYVHECGPTALRRELLAMGARLFAARIEEWARKQTDPEVIAIMDAMGIGPNRSKGQ